MNESIQSPDIKLFIFLPFEGIWYVVPAFLGLLVVFLRCENVL